MSKPLMSNPQSASAPPIMEVRGLSVVVNTVAGERSILSDIDLTVAPRSVLGIIGESGSGKTVLSRALVNWIKPPLKITKGIVNYGGRDLLTLPACQMAGLRGREIAYIGANPTSALDPTVRSGVGSSKSSARSRPTCREARPASVSSIRLKRSAFHRRRSASTNIRSSSPAA